MDSAVMLRNGCLAFSYRQAARSNTKLTQLPTGQSEKNGFKKLSKAEGKSQYAQHSHE